MVGFFDQLHNSLLIGSAERHIGYVADFLARRYPGDFIGQFPEYEMFCRTLAVEPDFKGSGGIRLFVQRLLEFRQPGAGDQVQGR